MMGIYSPTLVVLVSGVWHASQWKPKWINVIKPHVIFQWFMRVCYTPDGQLLMPCSVPYLHAPHDQNNEDFKTNLSLLWWKTGVSLPQFGVTSFCPWFSAPPAPLLVVYRSLNSSFVFNCKSWGKISFPHIYELKLLENKIGLNFSQWINFNLLT